MARRTRKEDPLDRYHQEVLPVGTAELLRAFTDARWVGRWYLAGGTALALQYGHRTSEDLDFFTEQDHFDVEQLERDLQRLGRWRTTATNIGTLYGALDDVKVSFIAYPWFRPLHVEHVGVLRLLQPDDIAVMKVLAVAQRGRRRDFVDLYTYCQRGHALGGLLARVGRQYPDRSPDVAHVLRSLVYFEDAENDPPVRLVEPVEWKTITAFFEREVPKVVRRLLGLR